MPTIVYDATLVALTTPGERDALLGLPGFTLSEFDALCAESARLAYVGFDRTPRERQRLDDALLRAGMTASTPIVDAGTDTQAFGTTLPGGRKLVAFRGTQPDQVKDLITDAKALMVPWAVAGRVHQGFAEAFSAILPALKTFLASDAAPIFTGHSLGAALATLAASVFPGATLVTIGSPRVGDQVFADHVLATIAALKRYVDCSDVITTLPPAFPGFYVHCGDEIYIDRNGTISPALGEAERAVDQVRAGADYVLRYAVKHGDAPARALADHAPINYIRAFS